MWVVVKLHTHRDSQERCEGRVAKVFTTQEQRDQRLDLADRSLPSVVRVSSLHLELFKRPRILPAKKEHVVVSTNLLSIRYHPPTPLSN